MTMQELLAQALVWESEEFFRLITGSIHDAIFVTDLEGRLVFANKRAEAISGYRVEEFRGKELWCILVPDTLAQAQARLDAVRAAEVNKVLIAVDQGELQRGRQGCSVLHAIQLKPDHGGVLRHQASFCARGNGAQTR